MSYSDFSISDIQEKLGVSLEEERNLFSEVPEVEVTAFLLETLHENVPLARAINTEKARSELIIAPVLVDLRKMLKHRISFFSGVEFNVDKDKGLNGTCDYIVSLSREQLFISSPIISIVEAKNDNIKSGLAQCAAEMIAARIFNERKNNKIDSIYGCVTTGSNWRFLKLNGSLYIDMDEYHISNPRKIMSILYHIVISEIGDITPSA